MAPLRLGILTIYLNDRKQLEERVYFSRLISAGRRLGIEVFVFTPEDVNAAARRINAQFYQPGNRQWVRRWTAFPDVIFDRCRYQNSPRFKQLREFRQQYPNLLYLNKPLANKWVIYRHLHENEAIRPHLPETAIYQKLDDLRMMLSKHGTVFLKPKGGTGGRGILKIRAGRKGYRLEGRDMGRRILKPREGSLAALIGSIRSWNLPGRFLIQQGLDLALENGRVHDYRLLMQKDGAGEWGVTGCAGRIGAPGSITSNIHGGGTAAKAEQLLSRFLGGRENLPKQALQQMETLGLEVVEDLEERKYRICELALDIAIDRSGRIWLLEINPKPSREVFRLLGEKNTYRKAIEQPLRYALWAARRSS